MITFFYSCVNNRAVFANIQQTKIPITVGTIKEIAVHFMLCVSFLIVRNVVEHGQCINENNIVLIAVIQVHPLLTNNSFNSVKLSNSIILPDSMYAMIMIGTTISLAGNPKINANNMTPSIPSSLPNGSKNPEH